MNGWLTLGIPAAYTATVIAYIRIQDWLTARHNTTEAS